MVFDVKVMGLNLVQKEASSKETVYFALYRDDLPEDLTTYLDEIV